MLYFIQTPVEIAAGTSNVRNIDSIPQIEDRLERLVFDNVDAEKDTRSKVYTSLDNRLMKKPAMLKVKVDTRIQGNVLPLRIYWRMYPENLDSEEYPFRCLKACSTMSTVYNGECIHLYGMTPLPCANKFSYIICT